MEPLTKESYYDILEVNPEASFEEIKSAFRRLAKKFHPDIAGIPEEKKFQKINEAYSTLIDPVKRKEYDRKLSEVLVVKSTNEPKEVKPKTSKTIDDTYKDINDSLASLSKNIWSGI